MRSTKFILQNVKVEDKQSSHELKQEIKQKIDKQDEMLDDIHKGLVRIKEMAININKELTSQNKLLDELHEDVDCADEKTKVLIRKTQKLAR